MAWPSVTHLSFIVSIIYLKGSGGQQNGLINQANTNTPLGSSLPSSPMIQKTLNQINRCPLHQKLLNGQLGGNLPPPMNMQQLNLQQAALQQQFNQQQAASMQQVPNFQPGVNFPQANIPQMNVPSNINQLNLQQPGNLQQFNAQQPGYTPQLQQPAQNFPLGLQPNNFQPNISPNLASLQLSNNHVSDISFASTPLLNQISGVPSQIPQYPDISYSYNLDPGSQTVPMDYSTYQQIPFTNVPSSVIDLSQIGNPTFNGAPVSDLGTINNQQYALVALPVQNSRSVNDQPNFPTLSQGLPNQVTIIKSSQPQGYFDPTQTSMGLDQKLSLISSLMSDSAQSQYPSSSLLDGNSILGAALSNSGSKSSNLQALLPLIFNLLKEKNSGCACHHCGCNNKQDPQVFNGYANKKNYNHDAPFRPSKNSDEEKNRDEEIEETTESPKPKSSEVKKKARKENTINTTDSTEYESDSEYFDNYDDEE